MLLFRSPIQTIGAPKKRKRVLAIEKSACQDSLGSGILKQRMRGRGVNVLVRPVFMLQWDSYM
jgi:hypothetical protein